MINALWRQEVNIVDERRDLLIPGDYTSALKFSIDQFLWLAQEAIAKHGRFAVALSGGSTPSAIYRGLAQAEERNKVDWKHVWLFWSDERCVPKDHPDSNYRMAMESGLGHLPILPENIFPMPSEGNLDNDAKEYENLILSKLGSAGFDLVMLGMGDDGHTASLFPKTHGLHPTERLVISNFLPEKQIWRMTLTFDCINAARNIEVYVFGAGKAKMVKRIFTEPYQPDLLPAQRIGTVDHKALWILDRDAATDLLKNNRIG